MSGKIGLDDLIYWDYPLLWSSVWERTSVFDTSCPPTPPTPPTPPSRPTPPMPPWSGCTEAELGGDFNGDGEFTLADSQVVALMWAGKWTTYKYKYKSPHFKELGENDHGGWSD